MSPSSFMELTPIEFEERVPTALQYALERRYYEDLDVSPLRLGWTTDYDLGLYTRFFPILEIPQAEARHSLHHLNMYNVLSSFQDGSHSLVFLTHSDGVRVNLHVGVCRLDFAGDSTSTHEYVDLLRNTLKSNFPGLGCGDTLREEEFQEHVRGPLASHQRIATFTGIPSLKPHFQEHFVQGLEKLIDGLRGERYSFLVLAEPIARPTLDRTIDNCRALSSDIHAQVSQYLTATKGRGDSDTRTRSEGANVGFGGGILSTFLGFSIGYHRDHAQSSSTSTSEGMSIARERLDKTAQHCEQIIDRYIARLETGASLGIWNTGSFLLTDTSNAFVRGQGIIRGLFAGTESHLEPLRALDLTNDVGKVHESLLYFRNPTLDSLPGGNHPLGSIFHKLATPLTTEELSVLVGFPQREVPGLTLRLCPEFAINPPPLNDGIRLGQAIYQGQPIDEPFGVSADSLTQHTFISGITGAGKTNTCLVLVRKAFELGIPFLIIEPAKTEYRVLMADDKLGSDLLVFTLGEDQTSPFRLNPFQFVRGFNLLTHIDFLKAVFNASFPMYASMPYILEEAILEVYVERGWEIASSTNRFVNVQADDYTPYLPTLGDLYNKIDAVVQRKHYAQQLTLDITAALKARLASLLNGGKGLMLNTQQSIPPSMWLEHPTVLELRHIGDDDEKAFLMALLFVLIYEYDQTRAESHPLPAEGGNGTEPGRKIRHLTLIEEAHRLLKNVPAGVSLEAANPRGKAVEMFTDILAEIREYGEGFIVVDQIPSKLVPDVVKNTNLKILHRIVAEDDRRFVGNTMGLNAVQNEHILRLRKGEAVVHSDGQDGAILIQVDAVKDNLKERFQRTIGSQGLHERMRKIRMGNADFYRRWSACQTCDSPCAYLSDWNRPTDSAHQGFASFFNALLYGDCAGSVKAWARTRVQLQEQLSALHGTEPLVQGMWRCHLVQLIRSLMATWYAYYGQSGFPGVSTVDLERQLIQVLELLQSDSAAQVTGTQVAGFRNTLFGGLARRPAQARPGCNLCRRQCHFGYVVQESRPISEKQMQSRLQPITSNPAQRQDIRFLVKAMSEQASEAIGVPLAAQEAQAAGFCYLANTLKRTDLLERYQRAQAL